MSEGLADDGYRCVLPQSFGSPGMARLIGGERYRMPEIVADNFQVGVVAHQLVLIIAAAASVFEKDREEVTAVFAGIPFDDHPHARSDTDLYPHSGLLPLVDDILSNGQALLGLMELVSKAGGETAGVGVAIEKAMREGGSVLRRMGIRVEALVTVERVEGGQIYLR